MAVAVTTDIVIQRPREEVAAYAANPDNTPAWCVNIQEVDWKTSPPRGIGSRILGPRLAYTYEVVELDPGRRPVMRTQEGPFSIETTYTWEGTPEGFTRMTLRNRGAPAGFSALVAPLLASRMRQANKKDLAMLREALELRA